MKFKKTLQPVLLKIGSRLPCVSTKIRSKDRKGLLFRFVTHVLQNTDDPD